jgi:hypothetical protein
MVDNDYIQMRGFHNLKDKDGKIWGFQFGIRTKYYKGLWLSQLRTRNAIVDSVVYPKATLIWNIHGIDYTAEEMYDRMDQYWQVNEPAYVKLPKPGGLAQGYHDVAIEFGWVNNYNTALEKEYDGSGLGLMGPMVNLGGDGSLRPAPHRRLLLVW